MASLGHFALLAAFVVCTYAGVASIAGARRSSRGLIESGLGALHLATALLSLASLVMVRAFVRDDYAIKYVQRYSDAVQPLFYKIAAYWGGLDGSMLFWVFLLAVFASIAIQVNRDRHRELVPYAVAVIAFVQMFFLFVMIVHKDPFDTYLIEPPAAGRGLHPLLQNPYMAIHPPALYMGFVGMTIPYAFCMAALLTGRLDDAWLRAVRRWTMFSWLFLSFGLILGMIWAYEELGWGGFWAWDPVENAGLLPWFTATAFLHSVMVQERRNMLRVWNVSLVVATFFLTIFGTFMTRSGVVQSLHAFGEDRQLIWMFSIFMIAILAGSVALVVYRLPRLRVRHDLDSWVSREAAFVVNNWLLVFSAFFVLLATMFPTLSEALAGERLTVGPPFFTKWMVPIGLVLLGLTGVGPLLAWRKSTVRNLRAQFQWPVLAGAVTGASALALGIGARASTLCLALAAFVLGTVVQEFWRGAAVRRRATGAGALAAIAALFGRSRRRYGGYTVHVGVVLMFLGFAGEGLKQDRQVLLKPGAEASVGRFTLRHDSIAVTDDGQKQMITAHVTVFDRGVERGAMEPARWFYRQHEEEPTTEVAIRRSPLEDLYVVMAGFDLKDQSATLQIVITPLVSWIWIGFGVMATGTLIALTGDRSSASDLARLPAGSAAAALLLLLIPAASGAVQPCQGARLARVGPGPGVERSCVPDGDNPRG